MTKDIIKQSVTRDDYSQGGAIWHMILPTSMGASGASDLAPFWSFGRDWQLYQTLYREGMWASAISLAITKLTSQGFEVESDIPLRARRAQEFFIDFDSERGWVGGLSKHLQAFILTGNGGPVEIVRATSAAGSRILGLVPLDTFRCTRTGDPDTPIIYRDRLGALHPMRDYQVFILSDMPDQCETWYGVGHCSAERAWDSIGRLETINRYIRDKVSGQRELAIDFVSGALPTQIENAKKTAQSDAVAKGITNFLGSVIVPVAGDVAPQGYRINLAELPDGFDRKQEYDIAIVNYARALGIAVQDLQPLSGQGLGTGAQTVVLDEAAKGQGLSAWRKMWEHAVNMYVLDDKTTFYFHTEDMRDRERAAKVAIDEANAVKVWVDMGAIDVQQALQLGVDSDNLPKEFIPVDATPDGTLSDEEKPEQEGAGAAPSEAPAMPEVPAAPPAPAVPVIPAPKAARVKAAQVAELIRAELDAAKKIAQGE